MAEDKKKGGLLLALGLPMKKGKREDEDEDGDEEHDEGDEHDAKGEKVEAAQSALDAIKANDADGLASALETFARLCHDEEY